MGQLRNKRIVQSRIWLDPNVGPLPSYDYDYSYPITVYEAVKKDMSDNSTNLNDEIESIYRMIQQKQDALGAGIPGALMSWTGVEGQIGEVGVAKAINPEPSERSHQKIPTERAVGEVLDTKVSVSQFNEHAENNDIHVTSVEKNRWDSAAPMTSLQAHITNSGMHVTGAEKSRWNNKAEQNDLDLHRYDTNNPHNTTAHQVGAYTRKEIDTMFEELRESFFNYLNISWDDRNGQAQLVEYHKSNWNPNFVLGFEEDLPEVDDPSLTYFALKPVTDYKTEESQDCIIYVKRPGMSWQECGFQNMSLGDMVIQYPDTTMFIWMQGRFLQLFTGDTNDSVTSGESDSMWRPTIDENGLLTWVRSKETVPPDPVVIKGEDGKTPIKGIDYTDGKDGEGVPIGGRTGDILVKLTDDNFNTTWRSLMDVLADMVIAGESLPEGIVSWDSIRNRPTLYQELGEHEDGIVSQKEITHQFGVVSDNIAMVSGRIEGPNGLEATRDDLYEHLNDYDNPHRVTPAMIGAISTTVYTDHVQNYENPHAVTAKQVGLGNVNNTSDMDKPVSNATQELIDEINEKLAALGTDVDGFNPVTDVEMDRNTCTLRFTFRDGSELKITIPILDIFNSLRFDEAEKDLVIVLPDESEHRVSISELIKPYTGSISDNIHVVVEDNMIKATIIPGTIGSLEIATSVHLRGAPTTATQPVSDRSTRIATTEFVRQEVIDNLISYETDRPLSANMGRILNQRKADVEDVLEIINDLATTPVVDNLESTSPVSALSANMGRTLDLTKAPRVHTSTSGSTFGRATISEFGHAKASDEDPQMDGTVFRGTDNGEFARGDHRHPTDTSRAPAHFPDVANNIDRLTGEPKAETPPDDSNDERIATTAWIRRNAVGVSYGDCTTIGNDQVKVATLRSDFMSSPTFTRQTGSSVSIKFAAENTAQNPKLDVQSTGAADIVYGGKAIESDMIKANHTYLFTFDGTSWIIENPSISSSEVLIGTCDTVGATAEKVVTLSGTKQNTFKLKEGISVLVKFTYDDTCRDINAATTATLNVANSGARTIIYGGTWIRDSMIKAGHSHLFTYDGQYWQLINPADPDFSENSIVIGPGSPMVFKSGVANWMSGHNGFTTQGDGTTDNNGCVNNVWFTVNYDPITRGSVEVNVSNTSQAFAARMCDGTTIMLKNPKVLSVTGTNAVIQFTMDQRYPSNSPCQLIYYSNNAWIQINTL